MGGHDEQTGFPKFKTINVTTQTGKLPKKGYAQGAAPPAHTLFSG